MGTPVYSYTYRNTGIDGYLVDHEPPHIIKTKLSEDEIHLKIRQKVIGSVLMSKEERVKKARNKIKKSLNLHHFKKNGCKR